MSIDIETRADGRKVCPFDHHGVEFGQNYREMQREVREAGPVVWSDRHGGFWVATDYETVRKALLDHETFTQNPVEGTHDFGPLIPQPEELRAMHKTPGLFFFGDGESHDVPRAVLNQPFSKRRIAAKAEMIEAHVDRVLDGALPLGEFDVVKDLAMPVVAGVTSELLGLELKDPSSLFWALPSAVPSDGGDMSLPEALAYVGEVVRARKKEPRDDLISLMAQADGGRFSVEEVQGMCMQILFGALENPQSMIGHCVLYLADNPETRARLRDDPSKMSDFYSEALRYFNSTVTVSRTVARDNELGGMQLRKGDRIVLSHSAANADPAKYERPDEFDFERPGLQPQHLALGAGTHTCLGQHLVKAIVEPLLLEFLERVEDYSIDPEKVVRNSDKASTDHFERLTMRVTALRTPNGQDTTS